MEIHGLSKQQMQLADQLWEMDTLDEVHDFINQLPKRLRGQARLVQAMIEIAAIDDIVADDDLDLANEVISLVR
jgi:hypothetical protein